MRQQVAPLRQPLQALQHTGYQGQGGLGVMPLLFASLSSGDRLGSEAVLYLNPFATFISVSEPNHRIFAEGTFVAARFYGLPQLFVYLGLTACLLAYAEKTLHFPDNDVKFIPKGHHHA